HMLFLSALIYLFFLHRHGRPRDLPSFPTRRSSDLISLSDIFYPSSYVICDGLLFLFFLIVFRPAPKGPHTVHEEPPGPIMSIAIDRKSTRLNSSHVKISYAVFCLKKKTTNASSAYR